MLTTFVLLCSGIAGIGVGVGVSYFAAKPKVKYKVKYAPKPGDLIEWDEAGFTHRAHFVKWKG